VGSQGFAQLAIELHAGTLAGDVDGARSSCDDRLVLAVTYPAAMPGGGDAQGDGTIFNEVASEYERHRPAYPDALIDQACEVAGVGPGAPVLEIGCGSGQLTRSLLARGLRVTAVEPGERLIARARDQLQDVGEVRFVNARLEDASLPRAHYRAVFSASAIHWIDPDVSWRKAADALVDGGILGLVSYFGLEEPRSAPDQQALRAAMAGIAPGQAVAWPTYRDLDGLLAGAALRRGNVSEVWAWLGSYDHIARSSAARVFQDAQVAAVPMLLEHTAGELNGLLGTMSFWARLSPRQRDALIAENAALHQQLGRPIRSSAVVCLVTARRAPRT
jgi:SAM-dependent methyltransferase